MTSRVARKPIPMPAGLNVELMEDAVKIKGPKGELVQPIHGHVRVEITDQEIQVAVQDNLGKGEQAQANAIAGTMRALLNNVVIGVTEGFSRKLQLVGVGYRVQVTKQPDGRFSLNLTLGLSHPVVFVAPFGITLLVPAVTDIEVIGIDKQVVGQVAADIRNIGNGIRKPEPYKGKGIRYFGEVIALKETKKK